MAPSMGLSAKQSWPYAPYHETIVALPYASRGLLLFLAMAALTLLICGVPVDLRQFALLGGLFILPFLFLMSGYVPYPDSITPVQFAGYQMKMLPALSGLSLVIAFLLLRKTPRLPLVLVLLLMALAMGGYAFIGLLPDEQKRNAIETLIQACLIGYIFFLALYTRLRPMNAGNNVFKSRPEIFVNPIILLITFILMTVLAGIFLNFGGPEPPTSPPGRVTIKATPDQSLQWELDNYFVEFYTSEHPITTGLIEITE